MCAVKEWESGVNQTSNTNQHKSKSHKRVSLKINYQVFLTRSNKKNHFFFAVINAYG